MRAWTLWIWLLFVHFTYLYPAFESHDRPPGSGALPQKPLNSSTVVTDFHSITSATLGARTTNKCIAHCRFHMLVRRARDLVGILHRAILFFPTHNLGHRQKPLSPQHDNMKYNQYQQLLQDGTKKPPIKWVRQVLDDCHGLQTQLSALTSAVDNHAGEGHLRAQLT